MVFFISLFCLSVMLFYNCTYELSKGVTSFQPFVWEPFPRAFILNVLLVISCLMLFRAVAAACQRNLGLNQRNWKPRFHFFTTT